MFAFASKKTSLSKLSLRFASITLSFAFDIFERVYTIEACAIPGAVYTTEHELHPDVSALQRPVLFLEVSATGLELHPDVSALQRPVLFLEMSTPQSLSCIFDVPVLQRPVLFLEVSTPQTLSCILTCLHYRGLCCSCRCLPQGLSCILTCLHYRGLCCSWRCLHHRA